MTGKLLNTLFVNQVASSMTPFMCASHPSPNAHTTILEYPSVLCGEDEHISFVAIGLISTLVCLAFVSLMVYVLVIAGKRLFAVDSKEFAHAIQFMIEDFRCECYYFNVLAKSMEFSLSMVVVVFTDSVRLQILAFVFLFLLGLGVIAGQWPLKSPGTNLTMSVVYGALSLVLVALGARAPSASGEDVQSSDLVSSMGFMACYGLMGALLMASVVNLLCDKRAVHPWLLLQRRAIDVCSLEENWIRTKDLTPEEMHELITHWQTYDVQVLARLLQILAPSGAILRMMSSAQFEVTKRVSDSQNQRLSQSSRLSRTESDVRRCDSEGTRRGSIPAEGTILGSRPVVISPKAVDEKSAPVSVQV
jgi:hypothetical protein